MAVDQAPTDEQNLQVSENAGTLAIDLGSTTTVVAFQGPQTPDPKLLELESITRSPGQVPSLIWAQSQEDPNPLVGRQVLDAGLGDSDAPQLLRDFKRAIGAPAPLDSNQTSLSAEAAAESLLLQIWKRLPTDLHIKRLVLTAPVEHYRGYRQWLLQASQALPIDEVALVDEPTAAALGAGLAPGSRLLVVDMGGSTIDLSIVALEGGEGRAAPLAQLLRFGGQSLDNSRQTLRCARVLGKAGLQLGGRDLDHWIVEYLHPSADPTSISKPTPAVLNAAERLKCRLSDPTLADRTVLTEFAAADDGSQHELRLSRHQLETLLVERGVLEVLDDLLEQTLAGARQHSCQLEDLQGVLPVGGGAQLPLLRDWLSKRTRPVPLLSAPPVEAVAKGALSLTPGVRVRDVLHRGVSLRCWDRRSGTHHWHPLFVAGQTWPSESPLTLVLAAGREDQSSIELVLGEPDNKARHDVVFRNGLPTVQEHQGTPEIKAWDQPVSSIALDEPGSPGQDCLKLHFRLDDAADLLMDGEDLRTGAAIEPRKLGRVR
ncbi:Hsp70 family protein [Synechococcus sp. UW140]|uniref:Hsp70 family protein n=1 Tax=Synechococcus sp. UW140 TaxID=368503 RepID=UPI000E0E46A4|nr:Hsp70 family protein [Synechococcus sp. UW140]